VAYKKNDMSDDNNRTEAGTPPETIAADYQFAGYRVDVRQRRLLNAEGDAVNLSSRAFDTLLALLEQRGEVLSKTALMAAVWPNVVVEENNLNQAISSLRKALGDTKNESRFILTVPGRGYSFVAPLQRLPQGTGASSAAAVGDTPHRWTAPAAATPGQGAAHTSPYDAAPAMPHSAPVLTWTAQFSPLARTLSLAAILLVAAGVFLRQPPATTDAAAVMPTMAVDSTPARAPGSIGNSIAVLPFANLNPDADNSLFALGLHDEIINQLTKIRSLRVIARNSVLALVDQQLPTSDIARVLRVESVLSGTLLFAGKQARVNLQLLDPQSGVTLWAGTYDANTRDLSNMIAIQSDIALEVATALEAEIQQSERDEIASLPTASFKAYRYNLAAKNAHYQQDFAQEWSLASQAVELDPGYFDAWFTFASSNTVLVATPLPGMSSREHYELSLKSAERMIELEPANSAGYALKAVALGTVPDWSGVDAMKKTLERLNAPLADRKHLALLLLCLGQFDEAIAIYQANLVTEPLNFFGRGFLMAALELSGDPAAADAEYQLGEELTPSWWGDQVNIFLALGRDEPLEDINELFIPPELKELLRQVDDKEALSAGVQAYMASPNQFSAASLYYAAFAARLDDPELSVQLLRSTLEDVWTSLFWLWLPVFDEVRKLESFKQLLSESGVVDYWREHGWPPVCQPLGDNDFTCERSARTVASLQQ
jgi:TolB-like protein/DNA-binding winged helix-turn-helix (wHTH) protein